MIGVNLQDIYAYYIKHKKCRYKNMNYNTFVHYYTKYINEGEKI